MQNVAGEINWSEICLLYIREPETASDLKMCSLVFDHPRYVHVMKSLCFMTTFDYLNSLEVFYML